MWSWLTDNAQTVQAIASVLGVFVGITTIIVLLFTVRAANNQTKAAQAEADAATKLTEVSAKQFIATDRAAEAAEQQAKYMRLSADLAQSQLDAVERANEIAEEKQQREIEEYYERNRPIVQFRKKLNDAFHNLELHNFGKGNAKNVRWGIGETNSQIQPIDNNNLSANMSMDCSLSWNHLGTVGACIEFESFDGQKYLTIARKSGNEIDQTTKSVDLLNSRTNI